MSCVNHTRHIGYEVKVVSMTPQLSAGKGIHVDHGGERGWRLVATQLCPGLPSTNHTLYLIFEREAVSTDKVG